MTTWRPSGTPRSQRDPTPVSETIDRVARRLGAPRASVMTTVFNRWETLVGPDIAAHARPESLRDGHLVLVVDHPAWATQLRFMTADLLARLAEVAGASEVSDIRIKVAGEQPKRGREKGR